MQVSEEGKLSCDIRYTTFSTNTTSMNPKPNLISSYSSSSSSSTSLSTKVKTSTSLLRGGNDSDTPEREATLAVLNSIAPSVRLCTFPKSIVDLNVLVLEDDGAVLAASCIACSIGLASAGIEVFDLVSACCVAKVNGVMIVDPTAEEERMATGGLVVGMMPSLNEITQLYQFGELSQEDIISGLGLCEDGCGQVYKLMKQSLIESQSK